VLRYDNFIPEFMTNQQCL